jgi:hypothetical protein
VTAPPRLALAAAVAALAAAACREPPTPDPGVYRIGIARAVITPTDDGRLWDKAGEGTSKVAKKLGGLFGSKKAGKTDPVALGPADGAEPDPIAVIDIYGRKYETEVLHDTDAPAWTRPIETYFLFDDDQFIDVLVWDLDPEGVHDEIGMVPLDLRAVLAAGGRLVVKHPEDALRELEITAERVGELPRAEAEGACKLWSEVLCAGGAGTFKAIFRDTKGALDCNKARARASTAKLTTNLRCLEYLRSASGDGAPAPVATKAPPGTVPRSAAPATAAPGSSAPATSGWEIDDKPRTAAPKGPI